MNSRHIRLLATFGVTLILIGVYLLVFDGQFVYSQEDERDYIGAEECASCHRDVVSTHQESLHGLTLQDVERNKDPILADFTQSEDLRVVTFPSESSPRAFSADDIRFVVGAGQRVQQYLYEVGRNEYLVLPAEWNVETGAWQQLALAGAWPDPAYDWEQNCAYCHVTGFNAERERWEEDGVQCEACHGPGSEHADLADRNPDEEELIALRAAINPGVDPQVCGQCHARGTSANNQPYPIGFLPGASLSEVFTLFTPQDTAHWYPSGHASMSNMQYNEWLNAGHSQSLVNLLESGAEVESSCLTCHSADAARTLRQIAAAEAGEREGAAPALLTAETAQYGVTCTSCHNPHSEDGLPTNLVQETYALCISCHSDTADDDAIHHAVQAMYEGLPLIEGIEGVQGAHFVDEDGPSCTTCHLPEVPTAAGMRISHALNPILPNAALNVAGLTDTCSACHAEVVEPAALQQLIDDIQTDTRTRLDTARAAVPADAPAWVTLALDFVEGDGSLGIHNYAYADAILDAVFIELGLFDGGQ